MSKTKIEMTRNYDLFERTEGNRDLDLPAHRSLKESMQTYGWLREYPMIVKPRNGKGRHPIKDGQHRFEFAQILKLPVWWVEASTDFDVATVNAAQKGWKPYDYASKWAHSGLKDYQEGLDFAKDHGISVLLAFALLSGQTRASCSVDFKAGRFKVKDRPWAESVAKIYSPMKGMAKCLANARFLEACMAVGRVKGFDPARLLSGAERCREKLMPYATRDAYLEMIQDVYNFGRKQLVGLKVEALMAMRGRNAAMSPELRKIGQEKGAAARRRASSNGTA